MLTRERSAPATLAAVTAAADAIADIDCADRAADICASVADICACRFAFATEGGCSWALAGASAVCVKPGVVAASRGGGVRGAPIAALNSASPDTCLPLKGRGESAGGVRDWWLSDIFEDHFQRDWRERSAPG